MDFDLIFAVEDILASKAEMFNVTRLMKIADNNMDVMETLKETIEHINYRHYETIINIMAP